MSHGALKAQSCLATRAKGCPFCGLCAPCSCGWTAAAVAHWWAELAPGMAAGSEAAAMGYWWAVLSLTGCEAQPRHRDR